MFFRRSLWSSNTPVFLALLALGSMCLWGQSERGTITGAVTDSTGAVIPGAKVVVTNQSTNVASTVETNGSGEFTAPSLSPGPYLVRVEKQGFRPSEIKG